MLRWLLGLVLALLMLSVIAFGVLFALTPSVGNAPALARAIDTAHHAAYPGPAVPPLFAESLVATEDHRFYSEPGVDIYAIARVAAAQITGHGDQGGATLYQQLAKMLYTPGQSGFSVEIKQVMLGVKLDLAYSKAKVLRMYADVAYFGHGYYGLAQASCGYFGTAPARPDPAGGGHPGRAGPGTLRGRPDRALRPRPGPGGARAGPAGQHRQDHSGAVHGRLRPAASAGWRQRHQLRRALTPNSPQRKPQRPRSPAPAQRLRRPGDVRTSSALLSGVPGAGRAGAVTVALASAAMIPGPRTVAFAWP